MELLTKKILNKLPALNATEKIPTPKKVAQVKFFCPWDSWTWYAVEYSPGDKLFFGLVYGLEKEWGHFSLDELESIQGPVGLKIERDLNFKPCSIAKLEAELE